MALIKCPECQHDISNTAINCPNCGCNIKKAQKAQAEILAKEQWDKMPKKEKTIATIITLVIIAVVAIFLFKACSNTDPSKQNHHDGKCDICGAELVQRADDNEETAKSRFNTYFEQTAPLIDLYEKRGKLVKINAAGSIDEVFENLKAVVK